MGTIKVLRLVSGAPVGTFKICYFLVDSIELSSMSLGLNWVEQRTHNPLVAGSGPSGPTFANGSIPDTCATYYLGVHTRVSSSGIQ